MQLSYSLYAAPGLPAPLVAPRWSPRAWFGTRIGRFALLGLTIVSLVVCFVYLGLDGPFLAIPDLLFFGLAIPIYAGWKRPRHLALYGLAAILLSVPITSALALTYVYTPSPSVNSVVIAGTSGPILSGAEVHPYTGSVGALYNFSVTVLPLNVPANASSPLWVVLWVSTCPGATGTSDPYCTAGYPFLERNLTLPVGLNATTQVSFSLPINDTNIWSWTMATAYYAAPNATDLQWVFLDTYAVQGPIVGEPAAIYLLALEAFAVSEFTGAGLIFFVGLLVYMWFKSREARRKAQAAASATPTPPTPPRTGATPLGSTAPAPTPPSERSCPNCGAVVYPNESACWKCGAALTSSAAGAPLRTTK